MRKKVLSEEKGWKNLSFEKLLEKFKKNNVILLGNNILFKDSRYVDFENNEKNSLYSLMDQYIAKPHKYKKKRIIDVLDEENFKVISFSDCGKLIIKEDTEIKINEDLILVSSEQYHATGYPVTAQVVYMILNH